eukprot:CAMPEP_0204363962 /NCGR_PEP_ID=MMETSP0469-20131031/40759_1 /ASSEMBLY_ACC=CAM_ASM_000384 /TAXON_ID=2969 /ORGANISM="Oxyrrhis marina" /LENGTH=622 /DNA_ID=CAMNT_0051352777 /DNA_START=5 /DNA_END=1873 /DNA_ORIENTATION=+
MVYIRNWKLGILNLVVKLGILAFILIKTIWYDCAHLPEFPANGFARLSMLHPVDDCDPYDPTCHARFQTVDKLPYCTQFAGDPFMAGQSQDDWRPSVKSDAASMKRLKSMFEHDVTRPAEPKKRRMAAAKRNATEGLFPPIGTLFTEARVCKYFDHIRLTWQPKIANSFFIPTRYQRITQKLNPDCYDPAVHGVKGDDGSSDRFYCSKAYTTTEREDYYVADIENFKLTFLHQFESTSTGLHGNQLMYRGFLGKCDTNHPKDIYSDCEIFPVPNSVGEVAPEDEAIAGNSSQFPSMTQDDEGADTISVLDLLRATPLATQHNLTNVLDAILPEDMELGARTLREAGGTLILSIDYSNVGKKRPGLPWTIMQYLPGPLKDVFEPFNSPIKPITYTYRPYFLPAYRFRDIVSTRPPTYPKERIVEEWHGIQVNVLFHGKLVAFDFNELLAVLTTSLALLAFSVLMVDMFACHNPFSSLAPKYKTLKFQPSEDFTNFLLLHSHFDPKGPSANPRTNELRSTTPSSDLLLTKLDDKGKVIDDIAQEELVKLLNFYEMRLNRLDAMDVNCSFQDACERDPRNCNANQFIHEFVQKNIKPDTKELVELRLEGRIAPSPPPRSAKVLPE